jgi:hypothetical protein
VENQINQDRRIYISLAAYSFALLLFTTHSSPLYAFNGWSDVNIHFTIGKGFVNGYVPYVDLIDYKGPLTYLIYGLGWLIDHTGFFGVYILQAVFLAVSVIYVYRLAQLFLDRAELGFLAAIASPIPLLSYGYLNLGNTGGSVEEFALALLSVSFYYFTLFFVHPEALLQRHMVLQGVLFASVFMLKFNLTAFFVGFVIIAAIELLRKKESKLLLKYMLCFIAGAVCMFAPFLIYMLVTNSLKDFVKIYFLLTYANVRGGHEIPLLAEIFAALYDAARQFVWRFFFVAFILFGYIFMLARRKLALALAYSLSLVLLVTAIYLGGAVIHYSCIPLSVFINMGIIALCAALSKGLGEREMKPIVKLAVVIAVFLF